MSSLYSYMALLDKLTPTEFTKYVSNLNPKILKAALFHHLLHQSKDSKALQKVSTFRDHLQLFVRKRHQNPIIKPKRDSLNDMIPIELLNYLVGFLNIIEAARFTWLNRTMCIAVYHSIQTQTVVLNLHSLLCDRYNANSLLEWHKLKTLQLNVGQPNDTANMYNFASVMTYKLCNLKELKIISNDNTTIELQSIIAAFRIIPGIQKLQFKNIVLLPYFSTMEIEQTLKILWKHVHSVCYGGTSTVLLIAILKACQFQLQSLSVFGFKVHNLPFSLLNFPNLKELRMTYFDETTMSLILSNTKILQKLVIERTHYSIRDEQFFNFIHQVMLRHLSLQYFKIHDYQCNSLENILKAINMAFKNRNISNHQFSSYIKFDIWNHGDFQLVENQIDRIREQLKAIVQYLLEQNIKFMFIWTHKADKDSQIEKKIAEKDQANLTIMKYHNLQNYHQYRRLTIQTKIFNCGYYEQWQCD